MLAKQGTEAVAAYGAAHVLNPFLSLRWCLWLRLLRLSWRKILGADNPQRSFKALFLSMRFAVMFQGLIFLMMVPLSIPLAALFSRRIRAEASCGITC